MFNRIIQTKNDYAATIARLALGIIMFPHGAQKVLGWFGGYGFSATLNAFTDKMHIPVVFALLAIIAEFAGSLGLILGLLSRVAAFGIAVVMVVATTMHLQNGLFMNWHNTPNAGEGFEFHILAIALACVVMISGGGAFSLDKKIKC